MPIDYNCDFDCNRGRTIRIVWYHYPDSEKPIRTSTERSEHHDEP